MSDRYNSSLPELENELKTNYVSGLSSSEANKRREILKKETKRREYSLFVPDKKGIFTTHGQIIFTPAMMSLIIISFLGAIFGKSISSAAVFVISLLTAMLFARSVIASRDKMDAMRNYASPMVTVCRSGKLASTDGRNLVPGDVFLVKEGDLLACDARIISCSDLVVDELTVKNTSIVRKRVSKGTFDQIDNEVDHVDAFKDDLLYAGSAVVSGSALAVVIEVGKDVKIASDLHSGALAGADIEPTWSKKLEPLMFKISLVTSLSILILSIIGLFTLQYQVDLFNALLLLISSVWFVSNGFLHLIASEIFSHNIFRMAKRSKKAKSNDGYAAIRNYKTLDTLSEISDLVLIGSSGILRGEYAVRSIFTASGVSTSLNNEISLDRRILSYVHTYIFTKKSVQLGLDCFSDGVIDSLGNYVSKSGFDLEGAESVINTKRFEVDPTSGFDFAYIETNTEFYRVALINQSHALRICNYVRAGEKILPLSDKDRDRALAFYNDNAKRGLSCVFVVTEQDHKTVLEAVIALGRDVDNCLLDSIEQLNKHGIRVTLMIGEEEGHASKIIKSSNIIANAFGDVATASLLKDRSIILNSYKKYGAFIGFDKTQYIEIIKNMKRDGSKVAVYCIDNKYNDLMSVADLCVSCDTIDYTTDKHKESVYASLPTCGHDGDIRASQQTRLLSKVIVRRASGNGGGLNALLNAIKMARASYISLAGAISLYIMLAGVLVAFTVMSILTGNILLNAVQTALISSIFAASAVTLYTECDKSNRSIKNNIDYTKLPLLSFSDSLVGAVARVVSIVILSVLIKYFDTLGYFGNEASLDLPVFACMILTLLIEVFSANLRFYGKVKGTSGSWRRFTVAFTILLLYLAYALIKFIFSVVFDIKLFFMILIIPAYLLLYFMAITIAHFINKGRNST